ncbi:MAG: ArgE/DapE family deacylase [Armatimonadota bacterium]
MHNIKSELKSYLESKKEDIAARLVEMVSHKSTVSIEHSIQTYLFDYLESQGLHPEYENVEDSITNDPDYTFVPGHTTYAGRPNIKINIPGTGGGKSAILNTHSDVVSAPDEMFTAHYKDGIVYGRGACDAKGQVATVILAVQALKSLGIQLKGDLQAQIVIEEEAGGNGSLSLIRHGNKADCAVVLEPTSLRMHPANRGAVWYKLTVKGKPVHMGKYWDGVSAIDEMVGLIGILREYETILREASKGNPLFSHDPSPVVVNIGRIHGGDWPSMLPAECSIEGGIAFLPNKRISDIYDEVTSLIESRASAWAKENYTFEFCKLHNEAFETPVDHPSVVAFDKAHKSVLGNDPMVGWIASCDARLFARTGEMPTITFGAGDLGHAHSLDEQIIIDDILRAAEVLVMFLVDWCGVDK